MTKEQRDQEIHALIERISLFKGELLPNDYKRLQEYSRLLMAATSM